MLLMLPHDGFVSIQLNMIITKHNRCPVKQLPFFYLTERLGTQLHMHHDRVVAY
jgi:hypothetical protein